MKSVAALVALVALSCSSEGAETGLSETPGDVSYVIQRPRVQLACRWPKYDSSGTWYPECNRAPTRCDGGFVDAVCELLTPGTPLSTYRCQWTTTPQPVCTGEYQCAWDQPDC